VLRRYGVQINKVKAKTKNQFGLFVDVEMVNAVEFARFMERLGVIQSSKSQDIDFIFEEYEDE
jgi:hypothetical protein